MTGIPLLEQVVQSLMKPFGVVKPEGPVCSVAGIGSQERESGKR
ncbi:MAG: hypothetical protein ACLFR8_13010 [Alkalispirochaeta sp.]